MTVMPPGCQCLSVSERAPSGQARPCDRGDEPDAAMGLLIQSRVLAVGWCALFIWSVT
jgi:hypothetical protein